MLGVNPPSDKALHNSMRCAPPVSAATADSTESTQISSSIITAYLCAKYSGLLTEISMLQARNPEVVLRFNFECHAQVMRSSPSGLPQYIAADRLG
jgi:hypothetical protein